jgi:hypothetical protein
LQHHYCSRESSRALQTYISTHIYPQLPFKPNQIRQDCPLYPGANIFAAHEKAKKKLPRGQNSCRICGKVFTNEFYLDRHFDRKHQDSLGEHDALENIHRSQNSTCLSDLCPIFGCGRDSYDFYEERSRNMKGRSGNTLDDNTNFNPAALRTCAPGDDERIRFRCEGMLRKCFRPSFSSIMDVTNPDGMQTPDDTLQIEALNRLRISLCEQIICAGGSLHGAITAEQWQILTVGGAHKYEYATTGGKGVLAEALSALYWTVSLVFLVFVVIFVLMADGPRKLWNWASKRCVGKLY